jgi:predicted nucleic acid-binding protein
MITALDTNVLLDILTGNPEYVELSTSVLLSQASRGALIISNIVFAELAAAFHGDMGKLELFLSDAGIMRVSEIQETLALAGRNWRIYRQGGGTRQRILPDFLIGAHAQHQADCLLTRDRGFYRNYFTGLTIIEPS